MNIVMAGAGLMGSQIGCEYALAGHRVTFLARRVEPARARVAAAFALARELDLYPPEAIESAEARTKVTSDPSTATDADIIVESVPEDLALKVELLRPLAKLAPRAILATNTSSLSIGELGHAIGQPERTIGTHYWNPPLLMPLVEVVLGERTDGQLAEKVCTLLQAMGKEPIRVNREVPGFIWNRLQAALLREAVGLADNGVASPETIDTVVRSGLARRLQHTGPFETVALGGVETWQRVTAQLLPTLSHAERLDTLGDHIPRDQSALAAARTRRDAALAAALRARRADGTS